MYNSIQCTVFFKSLLSTQTCLLKKKRWHFRQLVTMLSKGSRTVDEISTVNVKSVFLCLAFFEPSFLLLLLQTNFWLNKLVEILHFVQLPIVQKAQLRMTIESIFSNDWYKMTAVYKITRFIAINRNLKCRRLNLMTLQNGSLNKTML